MRIAILEDDPDQLALLSRWLGNAGHEVHGYLAGREILVASKQQNFDLFVLDWEVPDISGLDVLRRIRGKSTTVPVLFITVRDSEKDIVLALQVGADDYMIKPARQGETLARVSALLRRAYPPKEGKRFVQGPYEFDLASEAVTVAGRVTELTRREFTLAALFFRSIDQLVSRAHLQETVWGRSADVDTRTVDTHVSNVRKKLGLRGENGFRIATIYNFGYRLEKVPAEAAQAKPRK